ncbi:MAG TPA: hypothetical protein VNV66_19520, partial [Pilimelia sp.]|nr:hypothetical protein [Pilimelia sp.]
GCRWALRLWMSTAVVFTGTFGLVGVWDGEDLRGLVAELTDEPDPRPVPFAAGLVRWAAEGLTTDPAAGRVVAHYLLAVPLCAAVCLGVGAVFGLVSASRAAAGAAVDVTGMARPASLWRTDRRAAGAQAATVFVAVAGSVFLAVAVSERRLADPVPALLLGLGCAAGAACFTAWFRFAVARAYLLLRYGVPWRLLDLLDDAHRRGVLRRVGATYQFRHDLLRRRLAAGGG